MVLKPHVRLEPANKDSKFSQCFGPNVYICGTFSVYLRPNMYIDVPMSIFFVLGEWFSVGYNGFTGCRTSGLSRRAEKMVGVLVFLANSALFHYFREENHTFLTYLFPNVHIFTQMCIFMANLIKFGDIEGFFRGL